MCQSLELQLKEPSLRTNPKKSESPCHYCCSSLVTSKPICLYTNEESLLPKLFRPSVCCTLASREGELTGAKHGAQRRDAEPALSHAPPALRSGRGKRQPPTQPGLSAAVADCLRTRETQLFPGARKKRGERSQHLRIAPGDRGEAKEESGPGGAAPGGGSARRQRELLSNAAGVPQFFWLSAGPCFHQC